jgi:hypothetical protein
VGQPTVGSNPTPSALVMAQVRTATRAGGSRSEDRVFTTPNAVVVLDGASQPDPAERDGGWIADRLGEEVRRRLTANPHGHLGPVLAAAIGEIRARYDLVPGRSPSTTVSIVRWATSLDILVLCDSPVVVVDRAGGLHHVRDDRIHELVSHLPAPTGFHERDVDGWRRQAEALRQRRNQPDGYWIAEADPQAGHEAVLVSVPLVDVGMVVAMTDGVSSGIGDDRAPVDWATAVRLAGDDPARLVDAIHAAEERDPEGRVWPRPKRHDDKSVAVVTFPGSDEPR